MVEMKWEANIKETLEKRRLEPSEASWEHLAQRMDAAQRKRNRTLYWWSGIAASVVAILFTVSVFFNHKDVEMQQPVVVETQNYDTIHNFPISKPVIKERLAGISNHEEQASNESVQEDAAKDKIKVRSNVLSSSKEDVIVAETGPAKTVSDQKVNREVEELLEAEMVSEIVAQFADVRSLGNEVTDADIDALLTSAQQDYNQKAINKHLVKVDAHRLLHDVETDLQQSFRNKVFDALKSSLEIFKTAIAERHQ